jgi:uncharacterized membrane protein YfcA
MAILVGLFIAALLYSSVGHAGASGYLAIMALADLPPATLRPTALVLNLFVGTIGTLRFARAGYFSWRTLWPFLLGSVPFAFLGGGIDLPGEWYKRLVGLVLLVAAVRLGLGSVRPDDQKQKATPPPVLLSIALGALIGFLAGLTGTGGGIFLTPLLLFAGWAGTRQSGGVSVAFILANSTAGLLANPLSLQQLPSEIWTWVLVVVAGGLIGTELGTRRASIPVMRRLLGIVLLIAGAKLIFLA